MIEFIAGYFFLWLILGMIFSICALKLGFSMFTILFGWVLSIVLEDKKPDPREQYVGMKSFIGISIAILAWIFSLLTIASFFINTILFFINAIKG